MDFFNKINELKKNGLEIFYLTASGFLFLDLVSIGFYKIELKEKISEFGLYEIILLSMLFYLLFYLTKFFRFLIISLLISRFVSRNEKDYDYYDFKGLLQDSVHENNSVKFNLYNSLTDERRKNNNLKHLNFLLSIVIFISLCFENSVVNYITGYKIAYIFLLFFACGFFLIGLRANEDEHSTTLIMKEKEQNRFD